MDKIRKIYKHVPVIIVIMAKNLYVLALDKEPHTWEEIISASSEVFDLTPVSEDGEFFKEALSLSKDCVVHWRQKGTKYVVRKFFVPAETGGY